MDSLEDYFYYLTLEEINSAGQIWFELLHYWYAVLAYSVMRQGLNYFLIQVLQSFIVKI
jgi:hypothetical protein